MILSGTVNAQAVELRIEESVKSDMLGLWCNGTGLGVDQQQAAELLPILEHFIKTGELPE